MSAWLSPGDRRSSAEAGSAGLLGLPMAGGDSQGVHHLECHVKPYPSSGTLPLELAAHQTTCVKLDMFL